MVDCAYWRASEALSGGTQVGHVMPSMRATTDFTRDSGAGAAPWHAAPPAIERIRPARSIRTRTSRLLIEHRLQRGGERLRLLVELEVLSQPSLAIDQEDRGGVIHQIVRRTGGHDLVGRVVERGDPGDLFLGAGEGDERRAEAAHVLLEHRGR